MPQVALAVLSGALLAFYGNQLPAPFWTAYIPLLLFIARCNSRCRFILLLLTAFLWSSAVLQQRLEHRLHDEFDDRELVLSGVIADVPQRRRERISLLLSDLHIANYPGRIPGRARFTWYQVERLPRAGERWQFRVRIRQPRGLLNPAGFDYERWLFVEGIGASGYIVAARENRRLQAAPVFSLNRWRGELAGRIDRYCQHCRHGGLIKALALGIRSDVDEQSRELLQSSGTAHLLAISGLHIGMVAMLFYAIGRGAWRVGAYRCGINRRDLASLCALLGAVGYAALAGFSLPTVRALIMLAVVLVGLQLKSRIELTQSLAVALVIILALDPLAVGSSSFWLSFGALLVIAFACFRQPGEVGGWRQLLRLQCFFALLFAPLGVIIFGQLNPASLPANLLAIPALSLLILPLVLGASLMSALGLEAAVAALLLADQALQYLLLYLELLLQAGLHSIDLARYPAWQVLSALAAILLLLLPRWAGMQRLALAFLATLFCWQSPRLAQGEFDMLVLDVGMGSSVLLTTARHSLVFDLGPGRGRGYNAAQRVLLPVLRQRGIENPDLVVVSHVDGDHSGGLHALVDRYEPSRLLSGTTVELRRRFALPHRVRSCHDVEEWRWDGVRFRFLRARISALDSTNNRSCVLQVLGRHRVLLPGDIEAAQENRLVSKYGDSLASNVLLAPHHGSATSSSRAFVERVNPDQVAFMLSRYNRWDFPADSVTQRYRDIDARLLRSDRDGAIRFSSRHAGLEITTWRHPPRRLWRRW